jgi:hypothetical protein
MKADDDMKWQGPRRYEMIPKTNRLINIIPLPYYLKTAIICQESNRTVVA